MWESLTKQSSSIAETIKKKLLNTEHLKKTVLNPSVHSALQLFAMQYNLRPSLKQYLKCKDGWINFVIGIKTETESVEQAIEFNNGKIKIIKKIPLNADLILRYVDDNILIKSFRIPPNEVLNLVLKNKIIPEGNLIILQLFNYLLSKLLNKTHQKMMAKNKKEDLEFKKNKYGSIRQGLIEKIENRKNFRTKAIGTNLNVKYLADPYLAEYSIDDFPRIKTFLDYHINEKPVICSERAELFTKWYRENGFENDNNDNPWDPVLRQGKAFNYAMSNKKPVIRNNDLIAGTTSSIPNTGGTIYMDAHGSTCYPTDA